MRIKKLNLIVTVCLLMSVFSTVSLAEYNYAKPAGMGGDFQLTDHNGELFNLQDERGKLVLMFFGYTSCPDVCPMELSSLSHLLNLLGTNASKIKTLFISVDPERDTPEVLKRYVSYFNPQLLGLTGTPEQIAEVTNQYHVQNSINAKTENGKKYSVNHSANLYMVNAQGRLINIIPFGIPMEHIYQMINFELMKL